MQLIITEKPSVAKSISAVLNANERQDGFFIGGGYIVSWCIGHLVELAQANAYDERFSKWRYDNLPIIPEQWKYIVPKDKKKQLSVLRDLMKRPDVDTIVCATDAGREGELIFRLVYDHCKCKKPIQRLWISSMEDSAIEEGFRHLQDGKEYDNLYKAALCRTHADWLVGINATRLFSVLYGVTLSVGRVITPTLALIVGREAEIGRFKKEPFYVPEISGGDFTASGDKLSSDAEAENIRAACDGQDATVLSVESKEKTVHPPKLFDLTTLQREANRLYGFTAQQTLDYLQSLYEKKLATYPRTDSRYLTEDMEATAKKVTLRLLDVMPFAKGFSFAPDLKHIIDNSKVSDHHAIIPTLEVSKERLEELPAGERDIFILIALRLLCSAYDRHSYETVNVAFDCTGHSFTAKGKTVLHDGWKGLEKKFKAALKSKTSDESETEMTLPELFVGQVFSNIAASVRKGETSPPKRYTEDTLLSAMECAGAEDMPDDAERKGLGTPATRAGTIEKLVKTGFVQRTKKQLLPSEKGISLITVLPDMIKSPLLTAEWEHKLKQVEGGEVKAADFMKGISDMAYDLVATFDAPNEYKHLFSEPQGECIGVCPRCGGTVHEGKKGFFCDNRDCAFALWKDNKFFSSKKKSITKSVAAALLKKGRIYMPGLYSKKTGKTYGAYVVLANTGGKYVSFKLEFDKGGREPMRKYENVDIIATLGAVMEINTEHYKSDFQYDIEMFQKAVTAPDIENTRLLWLSRPSGTECFKERDALIDGTYPNTSWRYHADTEDTILAYSVEITGTENGKVKGNLYELDYRRQVEQLKKSALSAVTVKLNYEDGAERRFTYDEYNQRRRKVVEAEWEHGKVKSVRFEPESEEALHGLMKKAHEERQKYTSAAFKL